MFKRVHLAAAVQAGLTGAVATIVIGFSWGGWYTTGGTNKKVAEAATASMVTALVPGCKQRFMANPAAVAQMVAEKNNWNQGDIVAKFVKSDDDKALDSDVAKACALAVKTEIEKKSATKT